MMCAPRQEPCNHAPRPQIPPPERERTEVQKSPPPAATSINAQHTPSPHRGSIIHPHGDRGGAPSAVRRRERLFRATIRYPVVIVSILPHPQRTEKDTCSIFCAPLLKASKITHNAFNGGRLLRFGVAVGGCCLPRDAPLASSSVFIIHVLSSAGSWSAGWLRRARGRQCPARGAPTQTRSPAAAGGGCAAR